MKLQHLAVIFVLIIIPISMVLTEYVNTQISTIQLQTAYTTSLNTATSDALKAFQINSANNKYSSLSDSKIRDIEASVNTFYNSLGTAMNDYISSKDDLSSYIPAMLFTLYDGYYIYSSYDNVYSSSSDKVEIADNRNYQKGLRPYIYYSCQYRLSTGKTIIANYTLDNAITFYGDFGNGYETRSGYLINYPKVQNINSESKTLTYDGVTILPESLKEHLITIIDDNTEPSQGDYPYIVYNNKKVYQDVNSQGQPVYETVQIPLYDSNGRALYDGNGNIRYRAITAPKFFWYDNYKKTYLQGDRVNFIKYLTDNNLLRLDSNNRLVNRIGYKSISAYEYYTKAYEFSKWVVEESGLASVTQSGIIQNDGTIGAYKSNGDIYLSVDTNNIEGNTPYIFDTTKTGNDPLMSSSTFNVHRMAVIRKSIETNLTTAIANYNKQSGNTYEFVMPVIDDENWYKIVNNVSLISFMQGMPIGHKYFNNYVVITNTKNEEVINEQSIYLVVQNDDGNFEYHQPGCKELIEKQKNNPNLSIIAYTSLSFERQTVKVSEVQSRYFYPQSRVGKLTTGCYNCIVNASGDYDIDSIISGQIRDYSTGKLLYDKDKLVAVRRAFLSGLARERRDLYKSNFE